MILVLFCVESDRVSSGVIKVMFVQHPSFKLFSLDSSTSTNSFEFGSSDMSYCVSYIYLLLGASTKVLPVKPKWAIP